LKERILDIAFKHFVQYGFARTTLTGIASVLGKRKTALYYYFRNKEEIFSAIVRVEAENLLSELTRVLQKDQNEVDALKQYITKRIHAMHQVASRYSVLKDELFYLLPEIEKSREPYHLKEVELVRQVLERGIRKGTIRMLDADQVAPVIVNTLKGLEI
jgi:AcrR family transcriptional regulator